MLHFQDKNKGDRMFWTNTNEEDFATLTEKIKTLGEGIEKLIPLKESAVSSIDDDQYVENEIFISTIIHVENCFRSLKKYETEISIGNNIMTETALYNVYSSFVMTRYIAKNIWEISNKSLSDDHKLKEKEKYNALSKTNEYLNMKKLRDKIIHSKDFTVDQFYSGIPFKESLIITNWLIMAVEFISNLYYDNIEELTWFQ